MDKDNIYNAVNNPSKGQHLLIHFCIKSLYTVWFESYGPMLKISVRYYQNIIRPIVQVWNEWDPLEEVIVGIPDNAVVPPLVIESKPCIDQKMWPFFKEHGGKLWSDALGSRFWSSVLDEHKRFVDALRSEGVNVVHPEAQNFAEKYRIPNHETSGMYCAMPRDVLLPIGNEIIEAPMTWRSRYFEVNSYKKLLNQYWKNGSSWIAAPKATYDNIFENITDCSEKSSFVTNESEPIFDAADFVRAGADIFAQRSQVTNNLGIKWVRDHVKSKGIRVTTLSFNDPRPMHIDATFLPLKPGIILSNPDRKCHQIGDIVDAGWKVIYAIPRTNINNHPYYLSSPWITMNILMLDENKMIVEADDTEMQNLFEKLSIKVIPVKFRHCNSIGGGFHCWTVDIRRRGELKSYFNWQKKFLDEQYAQHNN